ncbi:hypothetical protein L211DRAFT_823273 [Terfezia boudieri ATCC MYA-4762]|uniref:ER membrane protein complex subunit 2 n=1 Tax=Terfezia boudieri ATCC MYA-4762 TaxID=1051890 RepID=A0A3N4LQ63_9PEZI|nr:hypothetical protein L211DRAFT_823273 [Terfezia boudieri ATCC MYA-4762]
MASTLLSLFAHHPPSSTHLLPSTILSLSQHAGPFLAHASSHPDTPETWLLYENLLLTCLRSRDDSSARRCLDLLTARFGSHNERVMALRGLYDEATAKSQKDLEGILRRYEEILAEDPTNVPIHKRLISLLTSLHHLPRAISNLTSLLSTNPTDAESWAELSHLYFTQRMYAQSLFCLEEIILIYPQAYNIFARMGEISYLLSSTQPNPSPSPARNPTDILLDALKYYLRSIELCKDYLRGYYGLVVVCRRLLKGKVPDRENVQGLYERGRARLAEIVARAERRDKGWEGYDEAEVEAARRLLDEIEEGEK